MMSLTECRAVTCPHVKEVKCVRYMCHRPAGNINAGE